MSLTNNSTFNKSTSNGYYSRVLYTYMLGSTEENQILYDSYGDLPWAGSGDYDTLGNLSPTYIHGSNVLPSYYWRPGKNIRVRGKLAVKNPSGNSGNLNMRFGLYSDGSYFDLAAQDNFDSHNIIATPVNPPMPVYFECNISCQSILPNADPESYFYASGFYRYNYLYSGDTTNVGYGRTPGSVYVPIWNSNNFIGDIVPVLYSNPTSIIWNGYGTSFSDEDQTLVTLSYITIEELA